MRGLPFLKKSKIEIVKIEDEEEEQNGDRTMRERSWKEQEAALVALIEHRTKEVEQLRERVAYYKSQVFFFFFQCNSFKNKFFYYSFVGYEIFWGILNI